MLHEEKLILYITEDRRRIPKGTSILICIREMNLNPEYFPNPLKFDPERFDETNLSSHTQYSYIPFSAGPRNCIGTFEWNEAIV